MIWALSWSDIDQYQRYFRGVGAHGESSFARERLIRIRANLTNRRKSQRDRLLRNGVAIRAGVESSNVQLIVSPGAKDSLRFDRTDAGQSALALGAERLIQRTALKR